jgi:signal transduction histidine kinase
MDYHHEQEFIGKNTAHFVAAPAEFDTICLNVKSEGSWFGETVLRKFNHAPFYVLLWMNLVKDEKGTPICIMSSFIDISDRKQMEIAKRKALEQIEKNIEQFAILGDHIRNPLAVIVGLSSLTGAEVSEKILVQAKEIDRIITQLDMGWIESENVRNFIKKYYMVGTGAPDNGETDADKPGV